MKIRATQPGTAYHKAALPVVANITVKADPASLTLIGLGQTYDGQPKPVSVLGLEGPVTIAYKVSGAEVSSPPSAAGSYAVKATAGKLGKAATLVIAKAPLYVVPDHKRKLLGQDNPELTAQISGFVSGETEAVILTAPALATTATRKSPGGLYPIKSSGGAATNYVFVHRQGTLVVESFAGVYEALLADASLVPVGKLSLTVPVTSSSFSAKLWVTAENAALSFAGTLVSDELNERVSGSATVTQKGVPYSLSFTLNIKGGMQATLLQNANELGAASNGRKLSTQLVAHAGAYTAVMRAAIPTASDVPVGAGWSTASISSSGVLALAGKLGDGTSFTAALSSDGETDPGYRLFVQPYLPARNHSFLAVSFNLQPHPVLSGKRHLPPTSLTWRKTGLPGDASNRAGFGTVTTSLLIDPWQKPVGTNLSLLLGFGYPEGMVFDVLHSPTESGSHQQLPTQILLGRTTALSAFMPTSNLSKWRTSLAPSTGAFTGSFELNEGSKKRTVPFTGVFRQPSASTDKLIGEGVFILPPLSGSEKVVGEIRFQRR